jgi:CheY-like chemotaxis protein
MAHVFDRFRQADSGTTRTQGGLGLGLAIVRDLVRLHGGDVSVESAGAGRGATFTVMLRGSADTPIEHDRSSHETASLAGQCVIVVEDHDDSRELMRATLENAGAVVTVFDRSETAFNAFEKIRPTALVADIGLPGEDGYDFIKRIRCHPSAAVQSVQAIAVTAYATAADRAQALEAGFQRHLSKPIDPDELVDVIHELARGRSDER